MNLSFIFQGKENPSELSPAQPFNVGTIMYTSGTSGDPKGVILTHENIATNISGMDLFLEHFEDKVTLHSMKVSMFVFSPSNVSAHDSNIGLWFSGTEFYPHFMFS